ncbi:MAG TPA: DUF2066 domain-containing protein [Alphaproteobacteria bacterium]|nr:DUF2066 domain-containing protein [Alphaproteobacteria bacterium]
MAANILHSGGFAMRVDPIPALVLALLVLFCGPAPAMAQKAAPASVFVASGVPVDETADSAVAARSQALRVGQQTALQQVLRRMTLRQDWGRLPSPDSVEPNQVVASLEIANEKASQVRYLADLTVRFKPDAVRTLLRARQIPFTETLARPVLVLPVLERGGVLLLFEEENTWRQAWNQAVEQHHGLLPLQLPLGDLEDITALGPQAALSGDEKRLQDIAGRYGADSTVVVHAAMVPALSPDAPAGLDVDRSWYGGPAGQTTVESYKAKPGESELDLQRRAAEAVARELEESWKRETLVTYGEVASLSATVPLGSLDDWLGIRKKLDATGLIRSYDLVALSRRDAQVVLHYQGDAQRLSVLLAQQDLELRQQDGYWRLQRRAGAPQPTDGTTQ